MTAGFDRECVPSWPDYADRVGLSLDGRGRWRTTRCDIHGGGDSLRVNVESGGWVCMACGAKGGDTVAHLMLIESIDFVAAARALGCWVDGGTAPPRPARLPARDALGAIGPELGVCMVVIADARRGTTPNDTDWHRFLQAAGRVQFIAQAATS